MALPTPPQIQDLKAACDHLISALSTQVGDEQMREQQMREREAAWELLKKKMILLLGTSA